MVLSAIRIPSAQAALSQSTGVAAASEVVQASASRPEPAPQVPSKTQVEAVAQPPAPSASSEGVVAALAATNTPEPKPPAETPPPAGVSTATSSPNRPETTTTTASANAATLAAEDSLTEANARRTAEQARASYRETQLMRAISTPASSHVVDFLKGMAETHANGVTTAEEGIGTAVRDTTAAHTEADDAATQGQNSLRLGTGASDDTAGAQRLSTRA